MRWLVVRSAAVLALSALAGSLVVFLLLRLLGGDVATVILGRSATTQSLADLRTELGLNRPWVVQYVDWLGDLLRGNLGQSYAAGYNISDEIRSRMGLTLSLALVSMAVSVVVSVAAGSYSALHARKLRSGAVDLLTQLGLAVPTFWAGLVFVSVFSVRLGWFPAGGYVPWSQDPLQAARCLVLLVASLSLFVSAVLTRYVKSAMLDVLGEPYILTAMAKGRTLSGAALVHGVRNASVSIVTVGTLMLGGLLAGTVVVENVFDLPGLGSLLVSAIDGREALVVQSVAFVILFMILTLNFLMDISYGVLDPRIRDAERRVASVD
ncbi:peptide/nickel transport system permease protein [Kribbella aluminosa]|uniref:Peptide/nickel transport system permease protein n=1 Tax=Kribbella aluminosa TaxID=416017 RepID=A0ABS4UDH1_9ACTN|nr:ABC transporter permease [Kribbella aluminosa]MBP2349644.1 peptide/nickel transport system permease protein [Kribbella aluminosa]